ncbi:hypothetical protein BTA51_24185 [Hahella sp. CCB-MM4]|nr:hypothetical protein BTA51_24185 [Hahella sp. CCB-MM4]
MNHWFSPDSQNPAWRKSAEIRGVSDINALATRVANVIESIDPDVLCIQEGPSRYSEAELFINDYLNGAYEIFGPSGSGQQKMYVLVKRGGTVQAVNRATQNPFVPFDEPWAVDINGDQHLDEYEFTREPLVVDVTLTDGREIRVINVHLKSKYVHNGERLWSDSAQRQEFISKALLARRRISAEAMRVREYLNVLLEQDQNRSIVVCGDFNDGPGSDYFERHFLTHNLVAMLAGNPFRPQYMMRHGFIDRVQAGDNYTVIFDDFVDLVVDRKILLDHILVSPGLFSSLTDGGIEHVAFNAQVDNTAVDRQKYPSDHRPQSIEIA